MRLLVGLLVVLSLLLTSCRPTTTPGFTLEYRRSGGIAGFDDRLTIDAQGNATLSRSGQTTQFALDRETVSQIQTLLDEAGFARLNAEYLPDPGSADLFEYTLTYQGKTVHTADTVVPGELQPVLDLLNQIVDAGQQP